MTDNFKNIVEGLQRQNSNFTISQVDNYLRPILTSLATIVESRFAEKYEAIRLVRERADEAPITVDNTTLEFLWDEARSLVNGKKRGKLVKPNDLLTSVKDFYHNGYKSGIELREWPTFSQNYRVAKRELTLVHGIPSHGKSEFLDAVLISLALDHKMRFAIFSPENFPYAVHIEKIVSKLLGKPFHPGPTPRMLEGELESAVAWVNEHFLFIEPHEDELSLESILSLTMEAKKEHGIDGVVVDPWNEITHNLPAGTTETEYIGSSLAKCRRFARKQDICFWIVAHPMKLQKDKNSGEYTPPEPYQISGSQHWYNKADNILCVFRNNDNSVNVITQKIKFKMRGQKGSVGFLYDKATGRYSEKIDQGLPGNQF